MNNRINCLYTCCVSVVTYSTINWFLVSLILYIRFLLHLLNKLSPLLPQSTDCCESRQTLWIIEESVPGDFLPCVAQIAHFASNLDLVLQSELYIITVYSIKLAFWIYLQAEIATFILWEGIPFTDWPTPSSIQGKLF